MKNKKGVSLLVLAITIVVIMILAGAVLLSVIDNSPIDKANEVAFKSRANIYLSKLQMYISDQRALNRYFNSSKFNAGTWNGIEEDKDGTIKEYIADISVEDGLKYAIVRGELVYVGGDEQEEIFASELGIYSILGIDKIAKDNVTINGQPPLYNNPIIPKGFKAINLADANWNNISTDFNKGLVIQDAAGNQFVWVPVDGTNVPYTKWTTINIAWNHASISDDTVTGITNEAVQITKYGGFYIARYEAMFDYNGGTLRVASKPSTNKTISTTSWATTRDVTYNGYLWNYIDYTDAKYYAENMDTHYAYDTSKVMTTLVSGTQWDTVLEWIKDSGQSVTDSRAWGNYTNSIFPANVSGFGSLQISGYSENWKVNNIYDIAGNPWEWTSEMYGSDRVFRGGVYVSSGSSYPAAYRRNGAVTDTSSRLSFRPSLYIL